MKDIASDLGVSLMTVSKALRNHSDISEVTRKRVLKRARELGYQPDFVARSLAMRRTYMVGLVIPDLMHSFFAEVAKGAASRLEPQGYQIVISNSEENAETEARQIAALLARKVDGLIIASAQPTGRAEPFRRLRASKAKFVLVDRLPPGLNAHYVGCDDEVIGEMATEHLVKLGRRRIAHLRGPEIRTGVGRLQGYLRVLERRKIGAPAQCVVRAAASDSTGYEAMRQLLRVEPLPDAVFAYNDPVAAGAIRATLDAGLGVPDDIAIIGSGNVHYSDLLRVPLSTIDQNSHCIGETAAELLMKCIESKVPLKPEQVFITPRVVVRESTRRNRVSDD